MARMARKSKKTTPSIDTDDQENVGQRICDGAKHWDESYPEDSLKSIIV